MSHVKPRLRHSSEDTVTWPPDASSRARSTAVDAFAPFAEQVLNYFAVGAVHGAMNVVFRLRRETALFRQNAADRLMRRSGFNGHQTFHCVSEKSRFEECSGETFDALKCRFHSTVSKLYEGSARYGSDLKLFSFWHEGSVHAIPVFTGRDHGCPTRVSFWIPAFTGRVRTSRDHGPP